MTMDRTAAQDSTLTAFINAATSDADFGYPIGAAFIPADDPVVASDLLWKSLQEGRPAILVHETQAEMLIAPIPLKLHQRLTDRVLRRVTVAVWTRQQPIAAHPHAEPRVRKELRRNSLVSGELVFA